MEGLVLLSLCSYSNALMNLVTLGADLDIRQTTLKEIVIKLQYWSLHTHTRTHVYQLICEHEGWEFVDLYHHTNAAFIVRLYHIFKDRCRHLKHCCYIQHSLSFVFQLINYYSLWRGQLNCIYYSVYHEMAWKPSLEFETSPPRTSNARVARRHKVKTPAIVKVKRIHHNENITSSSYWVRYT